MGKYIRKSKTDGETIALMDVSSSSLGVLTRAKSLALQRRLQKPSSSSSLPTSPLPSPPSQQRKQRADVGGSYLQLRSRRLQKKPPIVVIPSTKRRKQQRRKGTCARNPNPNPQNLDSQLASHRGSLVDGSRSDSVAESTVFGKEKVVSIGDKELNGEINIDPCVETSFGENFLELEGSERTTRESTPCSLRGKPEIITSPGSATKLNEGVSDISKPKESLLGTRSHVPTTNEMDEFFSGPEEEQQRQFIEKYNFDPVNEQPLPGRFEWKKVED